MSRPDLLSPVPQFDFDASWATFATGEHQTDFEGIPMWKLADDLSRYITLVQDAVPDLIVEVGTRWGGSALWFAAHAMCDVVTIDIDHSGIEQARQHQLARDGVVQWVRGNSIAPSTFRAAADRAARYRKVMVVLDGEHAAPHVAAEIAMYRELVSPGQYLVVEDGIFDLAGPQRSHLGGARIPVEGGPLEAISALLPDDPRFARETALEAVSPRSYHPAGFWLKGDR